MAPEPERRPSLVSLLTPPFRLTVSRWKVAAFLQRRRVERGLSVDGAAAAAGCSPARIRRLENPEGRLPSTDEAVRLLQAYEVRGEALFAEARDLVARAGEPGWWHRYGDVAAEWVRLLLDLETHAFAVRTYEPLGVPGLFQTEEYARMVMCSGLPHADLEEVAARVALRSERQQLVTSGALEVWALIDESVLRREVGSNAVMAGQVRHLIRLAGLPNVLLQVVPFTAGSSGARLNHPVTLLRFPKDGLPDIVYLEHHTGAHYLDGEKETEVYRGALDLLCVEALSREETLAKLERAASLYA
ncbi:helix-turn-helix transcriptional regulator [Streptomyces sp. DSM 44917]|uniref:Helix-turn-helix transcriptional regulator n=1 Tax=Streptomyces boetiae TaxID=3075541 RepID=A0ABU2L4B3_9ACTN|nr:helix-turn-helix transcriptional regulator [Streptomyces sp. DSM 44917]MDT0306393.1 helix-turn-helix transcriptional regulator [Streptomyces sp. DSM 44917]